MGKKKQFINKKTSHKFTLVHRSQRDPLQADDESSQHVLIPVGNSANDPFSSVQKIQEDNRKYGIYFDDDYDYMQHLRPRGEGMLVYADETKDEGKYDKKIEKRNEKVSFGNLLLPSEALPSKEEEDVGMLNKGILLRGPQPDWDPDIVAALDDVLDLDDPDNLLEDNFIMMANDNSDYPNKSNNEYLYDFRQEDADKDWETDSDSCNEIDSDHLLSEENFDDDDEEEVDDDEETKSRFTNYSMTSSVIHRTQGLKLLDEQFERIMEEYDVDEIGCIDHEDVTGKMDVNNELVSQIVDEFISDQKLHGLSKIRDGNEHIAKPIDNTNESEEESDEKLFAQFANESKEKWDCESIISTYSNVYNHPKLIIEEQRTKRFQLDRHTGIPIGVLNDNKSGKKLDKGNLDDLEEHIALNNIRNKNETLEEKRLRKKEVKEQRRNRRVEKKNNTLAFRNEYKKQEKIAMNTEAQKGIKM